MTAERTLVRLQLRMCLRGALAWGAGLSAGLAVNASAWSAAYPTQAARSELARSIGSSSAFRAFAGPAVALDTIGGFVSWRIGVSALTMLGIWGLLTATRLLRGEEDAGRWDVVLSTPVTARSATTATLGAIGAAVACQWAIVLGTLLALGPAYDLPAAGSLWFASALALGAGAFVAAGALAAQVAAPRRAAAGIAGGVLAVAMAVRVAADGTSAGWLRWLSPLGWLSEVRAFGDARPAVLLLYLAWIALCAAGAVTLGGRRDASTGMLPSRDRVEGRTGMLRTPARAALHSARGAAVAWTAGAAAFAFLIGSIAPTVRDTLGNSGIERFLEGFASFASVRAYLAFGGFLVLSLVLSIVLGGSVSGHVDEERAGRADTVLSSGISRRRWLSTRVAAAAATAVVMSVAFPLAAWAGVALASDGVALRSMLAAGLGALPVGAAFLGAGVALYGLAPHLAGQAAYGLVAASFLLEVIGSVARWPRWIVGASPFHHMPAAPLLPVDVSTSLVLLAIGALGVAVGLEAFARRDLRIG